MSMCFLGRTWRFPERCSLLPGARRSLPPSALRAPGSRKNRRFLAKSCMFWGAPEAAQHISGKKTGRPRKGPTIRTGPTHMKFLETAVLGAAPPQLYTHAFEFARRPNLAVRARARVAGGPIPDRRQYHKYSSRAPVVRRTSTWFLRPRSRGGGRGPPPPPWPPCVCAPDRLDCLGDASCAMGCRSRVRLLSSSMLLVRHIRIIRRSVRPPARLQSVCARGSMPDP